MIRCFAIFCAAIVLSACVRPASTSPAATPSISVLSVSIVRVRISPENGIFVTGTTNLPNGECVKTELLANDAVEPWWPRDVCVQVDSGQWEILVPLGRHGAPARLNADAQYEIRVFWPTDPERVTDNLHFNVNSPEEPD
jgi:hypothetical protein